MIRAAILAVWVGVVALGAERALLQREARQQAEAATLAAAGPAERIETRKAKPLSAPIARGGRLRGYVVVQLAYVVESGEAARFGRDIDPYVLDEGFAALYADASFDPDHLETYDLARFKAALTERLAARMGARVVRDVLIQDFNYVAASDIRQ